VALAISHKRSYFAGTNLNFLLVFGNVEACTVFQPGSFAFEAAARHQSIKEGADELCVTPAAVGHQIRELECFLEVDLVSCITYGFFRRRS
jgi:hypothetical protein